MSQNSWYNQTCGGRTRGDVGSPGLTEEANTVCFWAFTPYRCCPVLIHTDAVVPYALMDSFCLAFSDSHSQQITVEGGRNLYGSSWCMQIGPPAVTIYFIWTDRPVGLLITESFLSWNFPLLLCNSVTAKKDKLTVSNLFPPLLTMILFLFVLSSTFTLVEE